MKYADFFRPKQKGAVVTHAISVITGPIVIKYAQAVGKILPLNIFESGLPYFNPFWNVSLPNESHC